MKYRYCFAKCTAVEDLHPGGFEILLENAGTDATSAFKDTGHSKEAREILSQYFIGNLVE
ncbi:hypothetical protein QZH41_012899, partial [Actinostola sp. cb2023]